LMRRERKRGKIRERVSQCSKKMRIQAVHGRRVHLRLMFSRKDLKRLESRKKLHYQEDKWRLKRLKKGLKRRRS